MAASLSRCMGCTRMKEYPPKPSHISPWPTVLLACIPGTASARERWDDPSDAGTNPTSHRPAANASSGPILLIDRPQGGRLEDLAAFLPELAMLPESLHLVGGEEAPTAGVLAFGGQVGMFFQPSFEGGNGY